MIWVLAIVATVLGLTLLRKQKRPPEVVVLVHNQHLVRDDRMRELVEAYNYAKEELGEEPTVDQIFLTRDQLRTQRELDNGTT